MSVHRALIHDHFLSLLSPFSSHVVQVRQVRDNPSVKAVVIRVDSPGGSALASDLMWREIRTLCKEKPVVASMVDVAASGEPPLITHTAAQCVRCVLFISSERVKYLESSAVLELFSPVSPSLSGGYYIAMACDEIVAEELTVTGSIGVVSSKFNAKVLNEKAGFGVDAISRGRYAEVRGFLRLISADYRI